MADRMRRPSVFMLYRYEVSGDPSQHPLIRRHRGRMRSEMATRESCIYLAETALAIIWTAILSQRPSTSTNAQNNNTAAGQAQRVGSAAQRPTPTVSGAVVAVRQGIGATPARLSPLQLVLSRVVFHRRLLWNRQLRGCHRRSAVPVAPDLSRRSRLPGHDHSSVLGPKRRKEAQQPLSTVTPHAARRQVFDPDNRLVMRMRTPRRQLPGP